MLASLALDNLRSCLEAKFERMRGASRASGWYVTGAVVKATPTHLEARMPGASVGETCFLVDEDGASISATEVIAVNDQIAVLAPYDGPIGARMGARVALRPEQHGNGSAVMAGTCVDCFGSRLLSEDSQSAEGGVTRPAWSIEIRENELRGVPSSPLLRGAIQDSILTGVNAIDLFCPLGRGQRLGLFARAGLGKSSLISMIAAHADADAVVIALVGERGREVKEFVSAMLGAKTASRAVIVASTSDESPLRRIRSVHLATAIAERLREQGAHVMLVVDSLTRVARAMREVGFARGELPVGGGLTPSVFSELPKLVERAGPGPRGSITALYTVLSDGTDLMPDPLAEEIKSLLDGHIILHTRMLRHQLYPAIDLSQSISRVGHKLQSACLRRDLGIARYLVTRLLEDQDVALLGGTPDSDLQFAINHREELFSLIRQDMHERGDYESRLSQVRQIARSYREKC